MEGQQGPKPPTEERLAAERQAVTCLGVVVVLAVGLYVFWLFVSGDLRWGRPTSPPPVSAGTPSRLRDEVSREDFGERWPLTVDRGEVGCFPTDIGDALVFQESGGRVHALNGTALTKEMGADIRESGIWAADPSEPGGKKNLLPLMDRARESCP